MGVVHGLQYGSQRFAKNVWELCTVYNGVGVLVSSSTQQIPVEPDHDPAQPALVKALSDVAQLHAAGSLDTEEFRAAKRRLLMNSA